MILKEEKIFKKLNEDGITIVIVTHVPEFESLGNYYNVYLRDGLIQEEGFYDCWDDKRSFKIVTLR
ncbi:hypothetical protein SU69_04090 [Thermosipho melanesiensis]|uniref:Uncharacterized protein n=2 Tax=Thermosipho melanesiensis TaxID=46541 RepID=A6LL60_THEM4|nr:hypothetical protein [Thermosipho melanesiensis]ABR30661.1 hypothetical protein Tmel_0799 [Thermosipho melanesiensis BI429]APT74854.1 hypothetical protein BW47_04310 [Thermosipho melanesiensis]OOC35734.1 hypothetical protein SU68_04145 [Thermosipho melanesiensis]OOC39033.1 hypothetical protein SU69_04090 [Thermosipho melanesiensis]OOC39181.1 hypothetical protein SU70_04090 [Thermosipho melanesiensis]